MFDIEQIKLDLVGQELTEDIMIELKETFPIVRHKVPGFGYTMEMRSGRINIHTDEKNIITDVRIG